MGAGPDSRLEDGSIIERMPRIETNNLIVDGKPFLILGAELQNSSFSSRAYMAGVWQELRDCYVNTVLAPVTWEDIEPREGTFDFAKVDQSILDARSHGIRLILLWFGAFKNAKSTYAPSWVKTDPARFPRAELRRKVGVTQITDANSIFSPEILKADAAAFRTFMRHLREIDEGHSTVLMVQVENEPGLLGDSRDSCSAADKHFNGPVPNDLLHALQRERHLLHPRLRKHLRSFGQTSLKEKALSWPETFGNSVHTDGLFMAYHFARYVETVAAEGKEEYPLPMFTNVWQNYGDEDADPNLPPLPIVVGGGSDPGDYPSGGAVIDVLDIWQMFAPSLDFIAPDVYLNDYNVACANYRHRGQPLFIPEQRRDEYGARRIWSAYGTYGALCASPFGIDTLPRAENPWPKHYRILSSASEFVLAAQAKPGTSVGFFFDELALVPKATKPPLVRLGEWNLTIDRSFVFGQPGPGFGMVIQLAPARFLLLGEGFQVRFDSADETAKFSGILSFTEKMLDAASGKLVDGRILNGDETRSGEAALMPNADVDYGNFPICVTVPARTGMAVCEVYALF